ncbi:carbohydrate ABC transporter permease [Amphibiibacter pelophylacis]|uniref:Sugar ABC transporter permease n=1 Tax=Amphibiibacter pelophylacis TaxID=1799477 RepID=A0ACC6P1Y7_9BURK
MSQSVPRSAPGAARARRAGLLMVSPAMILMAVFLILPFVLAFAMSFTNQRLVSPNPTEYVGLDNYRQMLGLGTLVLAPEKDAQGQTVRDDSGQPQYPSLRQYTRGNPEYPHLDRKKEWFHFDWTGDQRVYVLASDVLFMKALVNTALFVIVVAPVQAGLALLLALLINRPLWGINVFRTIYFMPVVISMVVVAFLWRFIYSADSGLLNALLGMLSFGHIQPVDWLGQPSTALWSIMAMSVWQGVGFHMIVWLSGLQTIPSTLYEAAALEGASRWQVFRYVTWPGLRNTAILVMVVITMQAFTLYPQIDVMTKGGPLDSTQSLVFQAVQRGYENQDIAGGSAISVLLFLIVLVISLGQRWLTREKTR